MNGIKIAKINREEKKDRHRKDWRDGIAARIWYRRKFLARKRRFPHAALREGGAKVFGLIGHDVDGEAVGRIRRRGALPAGHQVSAQQHQQHQRHQAHGQTANLRHGMSGAGG